MVHEAEMSEIEDPDEVGLEVTEGLRWPNKDDGNSPVGDQMLRALPDFRTENKLESSGIKII